jgi:phosphate starvation-inducible protein PhoH and related proteins
VRRYTIREKSKKSSPDKASLKLRKPFVPKNDSQRKYVSAIERHDILFSVGPAGTGKTYIAVAQAITALSTGKVKKIILARPAVEAGEKLGFLPGTMQEKVDPYMRPLYDALHDMLDPAYLQKLMTEGTIEIAPLAFMRGRTLNHAFVILDEAQNTTPDQMKMFLTRLGFDSKMVVTGDMTQIDLPNGKLCGLADAVKLFTDTEGFGVHEFHTEDVCRHDLVQVVISKYENRKA